LRGNFNQLREIKAQYPHLRVLISVGGRTWSKGFHDAAMTEASRQRVAESCIDIYIRGNLPVADGAGGPGVPGPQRRAELRRVGHFRQHGADQRGLPAAGLALAARSKGIVCRELGGGGWGSPASPAEVVHADVRR
jgi:hypothetical protein